MRSLLTRLGLLLLLVLTGVLSLGAACHGSRPQTPSLRPEARPTPATANPNAPTLRLYYLVDLDGYLEPCGCQARPLGGIDRLAQWMDAHRGDAPESLFVSVGDLLFRDPTMDARMAFQETAKAESMVRILDQLHLAAFTPGPSDFVRGSAEWQRLERASHAQALVANSADAMGGLRHSTLLREVHGVRVGIVGLADFRESNEGPATPESPATTDAVEAARSSVAELRRQGARVVVVLASLPRRAARSIASGVPGVDFVIAAREESNTPPPPERIGGAYLLTATNQGKGLGVVDLYLRDDGALADASESSVRAQQSYLDGQLTRLRAQLAQWEADPAQDRTAVAQMRTRLANLEQQRARLNGGAPAPERGSYFRAQVVEVGPELARRDDVERTIATYFREVNEHNRAEYAGIAPRPPVPGQPSYVGMEQCRDCHAEAFDIWERTPHSRAYHTLEVANKNYNLSCVSCHVTGYQRPGGAEVVQNDGRRDVQCESCHGPGSNHVRARGAAALRASIVRAPQSNFCVGECHQPEHSDHFDYNVYLPRILGPGHGFPVGSDGGGVRLSMPVIANGQGGDVHTTSHTDAGGVDASARQ